MWRSPSLAPLLLIIMPITALGSNPGPSTNGESDTAQCNIRLLIHERYERAPIEIENQHLSLAGSGPLNPFIIQVNGELATPNPIISGCYDLHLGLQAQGPRESGLLQMLIEPL